MTLIGALTAGMMGRFWVRTSERMLNRMPVIRSVYGAIKQIFETVLSNKSDAFREVVLFEYPRRGSWAMGFITGKTEGEIQDATADEVVNVFLPTTPLKSDIGISAVSPQTGTGRPLHDGGGGHKNGCVRRYCHARRPSSRTRKRSIVKVAASDGDNKTIIVPESDWPGADQADKKKAAGE